MKLGKTHPHQLAKVREAWKQKEIELSWRTREEHFRKINSQNKKKWIDKVTKEREVEESWKIWNRRRNNPYWNGTFKHNKEAK